jgi:AraC family transcriptional regulator
MLTKLPSGFFYGTTTLRRDIGGLTFSESVYRDELHIPEHEHANAFFNLVLEGTYTEICRNQVRTRGPWTVALHPSGEAHADRWHGLGGRVFHVEISSSRLQHVREHSSVLSSAAEFRSGLPVWLATRLYHEYLRQDAVSPLAMEGLVLELLAECSRDRPPASSQTPPSWLEPVRQLLHERFTQDLTHDVIAATAGVHPVHLARVFRQHCGRTVGDYLRKLRVDFAARQLMATDIPLADLASAAGFADQSHLNRTFKRQIGMTPAAFRRSCRSR